MAVRFLVGRAGVGKTHTCLAAVQAELAAPPLDGPPLVLLVPEQASLQMERALLSGPVRAMARAEVLSFRRLALRILGRAGTPPKEAISAAGRAMVLRRLLGELAPQLRYYRRVERFSGFLDRLGGSLSELLEEAVTPDDLRLAAADASASPARAAKLADLADVYAAYLAYLGDERLDAGQYLQLAREAWPRTDYLRGARVWVDGFAGFTRQELQLLATLAQRTAQMEMALLVDPTALADAEAMGDVDPASLFARPVRTLRALRRSLTAAGVDIEKTVVIAPDPPPRFAGATQLAALERGLAGPARRQAANGVSNDQLQLVEAPDRRTEVEYAVAQVCRWVQESGGRVRYRDIAIIVRDFGPYGDLLSAALASRHIPFFLDQRRGLAHHPLVEFVRAAMALAASPFALEPMRLLLKTGLLDLSDHLADELENYLLAHGISGVEAWNSPEWAFRKARRQETEPSDAEKQHLARVHAARQSVHAPLSTFFGPLTPHRTGHEWAAVLRDLLNKIGVIGPTGQLERWAVDCEKEGDAEQAAAHRQTADEVLALLADLERNLGDAAMDAAEAAAVIEAGLAQLTLGLIPPTLDQVLVGSIERSRHPAIRAAILLGFNDGVIPQQPAEDSVLNDDDRAILERRMGAVGVTRDQRLLDEALLAYIAVTRASERLVITFATADESGRPLQPSPYLDWIRAAAPGLQSLRLRLPSATRAMWTIQTASDLAATLASEFRGRPALAEDDIAVRRRWNDLYAQARLSPLLPPMLRPALGALVFRNEARLSADVVRKLRGKADFYASVSELESFAACAFQHFAKYGLRLQERDERTLEPTDMGTVHHAILEEFVSSCLGDGVDFADAPAEDVLRRLTSAAKKAEEHFARGGELARARDTYLLARSARDLAAIVSRQQISAKGGRFRPKAAERKFGIPDPDSLPALELHTPKGRRVLLRGYIDRVDIAELGEDLSGVVVIDYKRTRDKRLILDNVFHGLSLQLVGYLLALAEHGKTPAGRPLTPAGAFYVSLLPKYRAVKHPGDAQPLEEDEGSADVRDSMPLPRGLLNTAHFSALEESPPAKGWARNFKVFRKADGEFGHLENSDVASPEDFAAILGLVRQRMGELADAMLDGEIGVSPYRLRDFSPCGWCPMQTVCRFEFADGGVRALPMLSRGEVFKQARQRDAD